MTGLRRRQDRPPPSPERLEHGVDDRRGHGEQGEGVGGCAPVLRSTREGEEPAEADPQAGVVGRAGQPAHGSVERRDVDARDGRVDGGVGAIGVGEPSAQVHWRGSYDALAPERLRMLWLAVSAARAAITIAADADRSWPSGRAATPDGEASAELSR